MVKSVLSKSPFLVYDVVGALIVSSIIVLGCWSAFSHLPDASLRVQEARTDLARVNGSLRRVEAAVRESNTELTLVKSEVENRGALPESSPVDANLQTIARLIDDNQIELINVNPSEEKMYPGLTELRYKIQCRSNFNAMLHFLGDFEAEAFWADLTDLKITGPPTIAGPASQGHRMEFVVSLFAARVPDGGKSLP